MDGYMNGGYTPPLNDSDTNAFLAFYINNLQCNYMQGSNSQQGLDLSITQGNQNCSQFQNQPQAQSPFQTQEQSQSQSQRQLPAQTPFQVQNPGQRQPPFQAQGQGQPQTCGQFQAQGQPQAQWAQPAPTVQQFSQLDVNASNLQQHVDFLKSWMKAGGNLEQPSKFENLDPATVDNVALMQLVHHHLSRQPAQNLSSSPSGFLSSPLGQKFSAQQAQSQPLGQAFGAPQAQSQQHDHHEPTTATTTSTDVEPQPYPDEFEKALEDSLSSKHESNADDEDDPYDFLNDIM